MRAYSVPKFPNISNYLENINTRRIKNIILPRIDQKNTSVLKKKYQIPPKNPEITNTNMEFSLEETHLMENPEEIPVFSINTTVLLDKSKEASLMKQSTKSYLAALREIEENADRKYNKIKENRDIKRSKSSFSSNVSHEIPKAFKINKIKEISSENNLEDIDEILNKQEDLIEDEGFYYYDMKKIKERIKEKINKDYLVPITDHKKFDKKLLKNEKIKRKELGFLKNNRLLDPKIEEILSRERHFYVKKLEEFYKNQKISI